MAERSGWRSRAGAVAVIATMAVAGGLLAEVGRRADAQAAEATYIRTAAPAAPVPGG